MATKKSIKNEPKFSFDVLKKKYGRDADALSVLLDKGGLYTAREIEAKLEAFYKMEAK